jgi:hypothetical protein
MGLSAVSLPLNLEVESPQTKMVGLVEAAGVAGAGVAAGALRAEKRRQAEAMRRVRDDFIGCSRKEI